MNMKINPLATGTIVKPIFQSKRKNSNVNIDLKEQIQNYQQEIEKQQELYAKKEQKTQELLKKMEETRKNRDKKMKERFEKELQRTKERYEAQIKAKAQQAEKVRNVEEIFRKMNEFNDNKGFGRIHGYGKEKDILMQMVGSPIVLEKDGQHADVPNGILLFGPKDNGKSLLAESFVQQVDCNLVKLEPKLDFNENFKNIRNLAENAQKNFEATGVRTIIQIDRFEEFAPKGSKMEAPMKVLIENLSKKYHCTLIATTTNPEYICDGVLTNSRFEVKLPIASADKENTIAILKEYTEGIISDDVDFKELADLIAANNKEYSYSNMKLQQLIMNALKLKKGEKITFADFMKSILITPKDISKESLELFRKQIEYIKHV